jgi:hypothetical protein
MWVLILFFNKKQMNIQVKILVNALEAKEASERIVKENVE